MMIKDGPKIDRKWVLIYYSATAKIFFLLFFFGCALLLVSALMAENVKPVVYSVLICLVIISTVTLCEVYRRKIWIDEETVYMQSPYFARTTIQLPHIISVTNIWLQSGFRIRSSSGQKIDCSYYMSGSYQLNEYLKIILNQKNG